MYTISQGLIGIWLMLVNWRLSMVLGRGVRWMGTIAGFGLVLVGQFPILYVIFVEPVNYFVQIPHDSPMVETTANNIIHLLLFISTNIGVLPYPIWSILVGRRLLRGNASKERTRGRGFPLAGQCGESRMPLNLPFPSAGERSNERTL